METDTTYQLYAHDQAFRYGMKCCVGYISPKISVDIFDQIWYVIIVNLLTTSSTVLCWAEWTDLGWRHKSIGPASWEARKNMSFVRRQHCRYTTSWARLILCHIMQKTIPTLQGGAATRSNKLSWIYPLSYHAKNYPNSTRWCRYKVYI